MDALTIGEVARQASVRTSTIRYYESMELLPQPHRGVGGHRRYNEHVLALLAVRRMAGQAGFAIAEMHLLVAGFGTSWLKKNFSKSRQSLFMPNTQNSFWSV